MCTKSRSVVTFLACLLCAAFAALASASASGPEQGENKDNEMEEKPEGLMTGSGTGAAQEDQLVDPFEVTGDFDVGVRFVDTSGNENKYREHLNYETGARLFNLNLDVTPVGSSIFNILNVYASHVGGDPYEYYGVTVKKFGAYNFRYRTNKSTYFYRDTILPEGLGLDDIPNLDPGNALVGDFRTFNFDRENDTIDFDFDVTDRAKVWVNFNRQSRVGESTIPLDISRDEFELDKPLEENKDDYNVGFELAYSKVSFAFNQLYRDYEDDGRIFLPRASPGEDPENATELFFFEQLLPFDFTSPQSTFRLNLRPRPNVTINVGYVYSTLDGQFDYSEEALGIAFNGQPLEEDITGGGEMTRTTNLADIDIVYDIGEKVSIVGGAKFRRFDQQALLSCEIGPCSESGLETGESVDTGIDIASDIVKGGVRVYPTAGVQITGGVSYENRTVTVFHDADPEEEPNTKRTTLFVNGVVQTSPLYSLLAEYEAGDYDNPFTRISPTSLDRFKVRLRLFPLERLTLTGMIFTRRLDNDLTDAKFGSDNYTLYARYALGDTAFYGGFTRQQFDADVRNEIVTAPGFLGGLTFNIDSAYDYNINNLTGGFNYAFSELFNGGVELNIYNNTGSFPLEWRQYQVFGTFLSPAGYLIRLAYQRNSYNENDFEFDDYRSNIVTVSVGYRF